MEESDMPSIYAVAIALVFYSVQFEHKVRSIMSNNDLGTWMICQVTDSLPILVHEQA